MSISEIPPKAHTHHGNCHCGAYRVTINLSQPIRSVTACSCIICRAQGYLFLPSDSRLNLELKIVKDEGVLTEYRQGDVIHKFCSRCGSGCLVTHLSGPLKDLTLLNLRILHGVNPFILDIEPMSPSVETQSSGPNSNPSSGACFCGQVHYELLTTLESLEIKEDNCSICVRNAWVGVYPSKSQVKLSGTEHCTEYLFGRKFTGHPFCKACGAHVYMNVHGPPQAIIDRLPAERRAMIKKNLDLQPVNVRLLGGLDLRTVEVKRTDEGTEGYKLDD